MANKAKDTELYRRMQHVMGRLLNEGKGATTRADLIQIIQDERPFIRKEVDVSTTIAELHEYSRQIRQTSEPIKESSYRLTWDRLAFLAQLLKTTLTKSQTQAIHEALKEELAYPEIQAIYVSVLKSVMQARRG